MKLVILIRGDKDRALATKIKELLAIILQLYASVLVICKSRIAYNINIKKKKAGKLQANMIEISVKHSSFILLPSMTIATERNR